MITPAYCQMMARYNAHQNKGLRAVVEAMDEDSLTKDRGAFFGSIFGTLNHLLWGDTIWMSRFDGGGAPPLSGRESVRQCPTIAVWSAERFRMDGRIQEWARKLQAIDLTGDFEWRSDAVGRDVVKPIAMCVTHFFNHQTHHRGQVHAMLTATGATLPDTDLFLLPEPD